jgi:hypothetical protein
MGRRSPGAKRSDRVGTSDHITFDVGPICLDQLGNGLGIARDGDGLFEGFEIIGLMRTAVGVR